MLSQLHLFLREVFEFLKSLFHKPDPKPESKYTPDSKTDTKPESKSDDPQILNIVNRFLPENCYTKENTKKTRICLHHTVSSPFSIDGDVATFMSQRNIATHYIISGDGTVYQLIPENYWAYHLGTKLSNNTQLNKETIGIEIDTWGQLTREGDSFITAYKSKLDSKIPVETLNERFRGSLYYQEYYDAQIDALKLLLKKLSLDHEIPLEGLNQTLNFELLNNFDKPGLYSHSNFRDDKSDVYPAKKLIAMLKTL